ncbi:MAG: AraC family transcriptional regulator [Balneolaceae bacterium]
MSGTIVNSIISLIIFQCFFCTLFLFNTKRGKSISNGILGGLLLVLGAQFFTIFLEQAGWFQFQDYFLPFKFLYGPIIFIYTKSMIMKDFSFKVKDGIHAIPFLLSLLLVFEFVLLKESIVILIVQISIFVYLIASLKATRLHKKVLKETRSNLDIISLDWLNHLLMFFITIMVIDFIYHSSGMTIVFENMTTVYVLQLLVILSLVSTIVLKGLKYPDLFSGITEDEISLSENKGSKKYSSSSLSDQDLKQYKEIVNAIMIENKLYLNPEFSLNELSAKIDITSRNLSYVINSQFDMNFADLVNSYRIKEAVRIFEDAKDPKQTILEVIYEVGFNSKSSFYTSFKKVVGKTPKEFKNELKQTSQN